MRLAKILLAIICVLILSAALAGPAFASKADELLKDAQTYVTKAEAAKVPKVRDENYKKAIENYTQLQGKDYNNTLQGVQALYGLGRVYETAKGDTRNLHQAYNEYKAVLSRYDEEPSVLEQHFESSEVKQVQKIVAAARQQKAIVAAELDKENSSKVLYKIMDFFVAATGRIPGFSYWFAIILVTIIVKLAITPLTKAQFKAMKEMQRVAPLVKQIQEKYKGDQKTIGEKTMDIYKEHGINPFASCLPILVQMPVLWLLYYMIRTYEFQFAKATFLWIGSGLSHMWHFTVPFFSTERVWFTAANLAEPDLLLVLLYVVSMFISTRLSNVDPTQAEQQKMMSIVMPLMFAFIFAGFPSAFLLYWLVFNILQTAQQYMILRGTGEPAPAAGIIESAPSTGTSKAQNNGASEEGQGKSDAELERARRSRRRRRR